MRGRNVSDSSFFSNVTPTKYVRQRDRVMPTTRETLNSLGVFPVSYPSFGIAAAKFLMLFVERGVESPESAELFRVNNDDVAPITSSRLASHYMNTNLPDANPTL